MIEEPEYTPIVITKEWSDYIDYNKDEYDIRLHDGTEYYGLYPNAGKFSTSDGVQIPEEKVAQIRLTHFPRWYVNDGDNWPTINTAGVREAIEADLQSYFRDGNITIEEFNNFVQSLYEKAKLSQLTQKEYTEYVLSRMPENYRKTYDELVELELAEHAKKHVIYRNQDYMEHTVFDENPLPKALRGKPVLEVKPRNKNGRNNLCTCGSGLKQKHCCK